MNDNKKAIYAQILKYTGIFGTIQGLSILTGVIRNKVMALMLGTQGMGMLSLLNSTVSFLSLATSLGLSFSAVREMASCNDQGDANGMERCAMSIRAWSIMAALLGALACVVSCKWIDKLTFTWGDHSLHYMLLSPAIFIMAITAGETAILKGMHRLKALAVVQLVTAFAALVITVPLIYLFNQAAIVPVICLVALSTMLATVFYSYSTVPPRWRMLCVSISRWRAILASGTPMVKLGMAFASASIIGSGSEVVIRAFLNNVGDLDAVGLYNTGYLLAITYAGMIFSSMDSDYYPRLAAVNGDIDCVNNVMNNQAEVSVLLVAPMMCVFILCLPVIVPLLFSVKFIEAVPMAQAMSLTMVFKSVCLPVSYVMLAKGDSKTYIFLESWSYIVAVAGVIIGYRLGGLVGTGMGLSVAYAIELTTNATTLHFRYGLVVGKKLARYMLLLFPSVMAVYASTLIPHDLLRWSVGILLTIASSLFSLHTFRHTV